MKRLFLKAVGVAAAGALLKACGGGGGSSSGGPSGTLTLLQVVQQDGRFSSLLRAAERGGLFGQLGQAGADQTLFAPTNDAFNVLASRIGFSDGATMVEALSAGQLTAIVSFHLTPQFLSSAALGSLGAHSGTAATLYDFGGDAALLIFVSGASALNIWDGIGRTSITLGQTDVAASNGVLHVVNDVLLPRHVLTVSQMLRANIDSFADFSAAMSAANIAELDGGGPFTVFVPSNEAITGAINVRRHVLSVQVASDSFPATPTSYTPLSGAALRLTKGMTPPQVVDGRNVLATLDAANVTDVDFFGSNGVIHVLDKVLT